MQRMPFVLRVIGGILAFLGIMSVLAFFLVPEGAQMDMTASDIAWNVGTAIVLVVTGFGLVLGARWSWPLAVALAVTFMVLGVYLAAQPGDITSPGATQFVGVFVLLVPGALLLWALLTPSSRRWFRQRPARVHEPPPIA
jgi:drug/metabolite transporter (DMT)-like permease